MTTIPASIRPQRGAEPRPKRWTREEYYELARNGFFEGRRVFLLDGEIIEMAPQGNWHSLVLGKVEDALALVFPRGQYWTRVQRPINLPDGSEPEPDISVVAGTPDDHPVHPSTAVLVVEVADSSLPYDRKKAAAYANAGVPEYWIVGIRAHAVEVYRQPRGSEYGQVDTIRPGQIISPLTAPDAKIAVADLFPKQPITNPDA